MKTLITNSKGRWFTSSLFFIFALATLFFALSERNGQVSAAATARAPIYTTGNFTFGSTKQLLPNPALPLTFEDAEPEIKIDIFGNIYVTAIEAAPLGTDLWKSIDKGATFVYLGQPDGAQCPTGSCTNDAGLGGGDDSIDVSTGGYLYVSSLWLGSTTMSVSYDGGVGGVQPGQKWEVNPVSSAVPADDRQWVAAYGPQTVYMSYRQVLPAGANASNVIFVAKSTDGGKTFPAQVATFPPTSEVTARREGNLVVDPYSGNIYTTFRPQELNGHTRAEMWFLKSTDGGATWGLSKIYQGPAGTDIGNIFPVLAVDRGGNVHLAFSQCDYNSGSQNSSNCQVMLMSSADQGATWLDPVRVNNGPGTTYAIFPWMVAGSPGVVDLTWYGSDITNSTQPANWHMYFAQTTNAMSSSPVFSQVQAIPQVVHNQDICLKGGACGNAPAGNRDLLEYYSMTLDPEGNANIAFADDFNNSSSGLARTWFTKQTGGPSAYAPPAGPAAATFSANLALADPETAAEPNIAVDSHNCIYAASNIGIGFLGNPHFWASENQGATFRNTVRPPATGTGDEYIATIPKQDGTRNDQLYYTDLPVADVSIFKSTDRGITWAGTTEAYGHLDASSDRQWIKGERIGSGGASQVLYEMDHELAAEAIRFSASVNDSAWSPPASGITAPEMILPPDSTFPNTNPGPLFIDKTTHMVYGVFTASTVKTNSDRPPFGKLPNVWLAFGAGSTMAGVPPGPFTNVPAFKGVFDSPTTPAPPAGSQTIGSNAANDFPGGAIDSAGNIYVVWATPNSRTGQFSVWFASSHDHGQNFYGPFEVAKFPAPPVGSAEMPWVAAGDNGRVDIVYYQTNEAGDPNSTNLHWNTMFAQSLNANSREPGFTVSQVSDHIMHFGPICNLGLLCDDGTRELADFFEVAIGPDGLANIVFADTGNANSNSHVTFARQTSGPLALTSPSAVTCLPVPVPTDVVSRKFHGTITPGFDIHLLPPNPAIEMRRNTAGDTTGPNVGHDHEVVFTFPVSVTVSGCTASGGATCTATASGTTVTADLHNVADVQALTVTLINVNGAGPVSVVVNILAGDTNEDKRTNVNDINQTKSRSGQLTDSSNFRNDVTLDGRLNVNDINFVKAHSGNSLP